MALEINRSDGDTTIGRQTQALDHLPRKADDDCLQELRWMYDRRDLAEVRRDLAQWLTRWQAKYPKLTAWVEDNIEETLTFYRLPLRPSQASEVHQHAGAAEPGDQAAHPGGAHLPQYRGLPEAGAGAGGGDHENWLEAIRYLNMGASEGAQEGGPASCRLTAAGPGRRLSYVGLHADQARNHRHPFCRT
jgi:hypothetical protein